MLATPSLSNDAIVEKFDAQLLKPPLVDAMAMPIEVATMQSIIPTRISSRT